MENNIKWDGRYDIETAGGNEYVPAWVVYERGIDDCDGHATIQAYFLKANGYEAWNVGIGIGGPEGRAERDPELPEEKIYVVPSEKQRPRLATQIIIPSATVLHVGDFNFDQSIGAGSPAFLYPRCHIYLCSG